MHSAGTTVCRALCGLCQALFSISDSPRHLVDLFPKAEMKNHLLLFIRLEDEILGMFTLK